MRSPEHLLEQLAAAVDAIALSSASIGQVTSELAQWRGNRVNDVLFVGQATFSGSTGNAAGDGIVQLSFPIPYGGVAVWNNLGAGIVTMLAGPGSGTDRPGIPSPGQVDPGRITIPGGGFWSGAIASRALTLWGLAGASVNVLVTVNPQRPAA